MYNKIHVSETIITKTREESLQLLENPIFSKVMNKDS